MPPTEAARTLRAAAEVFVPGADGSPGAAEVEADRFLAHYLDVLMPGLSEMLPQILDEAAGTAGASGFADASASERARALVALEQHEVEAMRRVPHLLAVLTVGAFYGEWTGQDERGLLARNPVGWAATGFDGPSRGRRWLLHP